MADSSPDIHSWSPTDLLAAQAEWRIDLSSESPVVQQPMQLSAGSLEWQDYLGAPDLCGLEYLREQLGSLFRGKYGLVLLHVDSRIDDDAMRLLTLLLGRAMGKNVAPEAAGEHRPLFAITATGDSTIGGRYGGNGRNAKFLAMHTDGSGIHSGRVDIMGLLCLQAAREGGLTRLADSRAAYQRLSNDRQRLLSAPIPRTDPYATRLPAEQLTRRPVFEARAPGDCAPVFSYHPQRVRDGLRAANGAIEPALEQALSELDSELAQGAAEILLERGDILLVDNSTIAHGRTAFEDDPARPRFIERLWIEVGAL